MNPDTENNWLEDLLEEVGEKISSVSKFKTHKQRKAFLGDISNHIRTSISNNTVEKNPSPVRKTQSAITRPNPNGKNAGFAVMTDGLSQRGDEITTNKSGSIPESTTHVNPEQIKRGLNKW